jgi:microcystin-dependent protein
MIFETDTFSLKFWTGSAWQGAVSAPAGAIEAYAGSTAPTGWLLSYGQAVSRTTYADLFAVISTTYGSGDGSTTFNLPDMRGRAVAGVDNMGGTDAGRLSISNTLGTTTGAETHTLSSAEMPSHTHTQDSHNHTQNSHNHTQDAHTHAQVLNGAPTGASLDGAKFAYGTIADLGTRNVTISSTTATNQAATAINQATTATNQNTGGGGAHNNMQPTIVLNYIIKF